MHGGGGNRCYFHPKEDVVGVCPLCLNDSLLLLAAKQPPSSSRSSSTNTSTSRVGFNTTHLSKTKPSLFGFASLFSSTDTATPHFRHRKPLDDADFFHSAAASAPDSTSTTLEDESFISIKFGDNGVASWDKSSSTVSKMSLQHCSMSWGGHTSVKNGTSTTTKVIGSSNNSSRKSVVEHAKPRTVSLSWRKRIGQLLEVMRWKKSSKAGGGAGNIKGETVKMRNDKGWVRTLRLRTKK